MDYGMAWRLTVKLLGGDRFETEEIMTVRCCEDRARFYLTKDHGQWRTSALAKLNFMES
jgi:hypothetical protein